nr:NADP-dependent oxidoreductase [Vallicoccus soli]
MAITEYGGPEVLRPMDLDDPLVAPDAVLVRVRAAGVNPVDRVIREGYLAGMFPSHFPLVPGWDLAGVVERVGPSVTEFAPGDEVVAYARKDHIQGGTYAELVSAPIRSLARKPERASWAEAAGLPLAGLTAWQSLRAAGVREGDTVLVHAAAGGVGSLAVQLARVLGAEVVGTASERNHDFVRSLGATPVAYGEGLAERVRAAAPGGVTVALDFAGRDALEASALLVSTPSRIVSVVDAQQVLGLGGRYVFVRPDPADLAELSRLVDAGQLRVEVEQVLPLEGAAEAHRVSEAGHVRGKLVLEVA